MRTNDQEPSAPLFPEEVLRQPIRQHRAGCSDMNHVPSAVLLAQTIIDGADVEEEEIAPGVSRLQQRVCRKIGEDERNATLCKRSYCGRRIVDWQNSYILQRELLVQEPAGRVVIVDRKPRASQSIVVRRYLEDAPSPPSLADRRPWSRQRLRKLPSTRTARLPLATGGSNKGSSQDLPGGWNRHSSSKASSAYVSPLSHLSLFSCGFEGLTRQVAMDVRKSNR